MLRELSRRADMMVILENKLTHWYACTRHFLQPSSVVLSTGQPATGSIERPQCGPEQNADAGHYVTTVYDPMFELGADGPRYMPHACEKPDHDYSAWPTFLPRVPCRAGKEDILLKVAFAYETGSKRRVPRPMFADLPG